MENKNIPLEKQFEKAIHENDSKKVADLLKAGVNPNTTILYKEERKMYPILYAATFGYLQILKILLWKGVNINTTSSDGDTALMLAAYNNQVEVVDFLIKQKADLNLQDVEEKTALINAVEDENIECVKLLVEAGANLDLTDSEEKTALHYAIQNKDMESFKILLKAGADVRIRDENDWNVMKYAAQIYLKEKNHTFLLELLNVNEAVKYILDNFRFPKEIQEKVEERFKNFFKKENEETEENENENENEEYDEDEPVNPSYNYPTKYTSKIPFTNITRIPLQKAYDFYQILASNEEVCEGYSEYLEDFTDNTFDPDIYGYYYRDYKTGAIVGFTLFMVDIFHRFSDVPANKTTNSELNVPYKSEMVSGILRCSKLKGIGAVIQSDIEDFARTNKIPLMRIEPATPQLTTNYYLPKYKYVKHSKNKKFIYKKIEGGKRKTRRGIRKGKSKKHKTRKHKH